jgi:hypothetical protein
MGPLALPTGHDHSPHPYPSFYCKMYIIGCTWRYCPQYMPKHNFNTQHNHIRKGEIKHHCTGQGSTNFPTTSSPFQILCPGRETWIKVPTEDTKFSNDLCASLLSGTFCYMHVKRYILLYVRKRNAVIMLKMFGATVQKLVIWMTRHLGFGQP